MPKVEYSVNASSKNPTKTVVETSSGFKIIVDEPEKLGGTNDGPNPVEYILASLSGCLNVVGHMVAREMDIDLKGLSFKISGELDPARFMGKSEEVRAGYQGINVEIEADCDADDELLEDWLEAVERRCPVSDNISNSTPVKLEIK